MIWHVVLVILFGGHQVELVGAERFSSHTECKEYAVKLTALPIMAPFGITCIGEVHA
jgi:hypothetical protein